MFLFGYSANISRFVITTDDFCRCKPKTWNVQANQLYLIGRPTLEKIIKNLNLIVWLTDKAHNTVASQSPIAPDRHLKNLFRWSNLASHCNSAHGLIYPSADRNEINYFSVTRASQRSTSVCHTGNLMSMC